jgi:hypothetical protein
MPNGIHPTFQEVIQAHSLFLQKEPRDLFYRTAIYLIELSINHNGALSIAEAISVLLQTWNKSYYRFRQFDQNHFNDIENLLQNNLNIALQFRDREITSFSNNDNNTIYNIFNSFENTLGPVGCAKSLHLLSPNFFPIWDRTIAIAYDLPLSTVGTNSNKYIGFINIQKEQANQLPDELPDGISKLKAIDEYNYCHFTKGLM